MSNTFTPPSQPLSGYAASVAYSTALLQQNVRWRNWRKKLTQPLNGPLSVNEGDGTMETSHSYPIVQLTNLSKMAGDRVTLDLLNRVQGKPVMGDLPAENTGTPLTFARDQVVIDLATKVIDLSGRMSQQRTPHDLRKLAMQQGVAWMGDYEDNVVTIMFAGARGADTQTGWVVPLASDPDYAAIVINPVTPPTLNRYYIPGGFGASTPSIGLLGPSDLITLQFFDDLRTIIDSSAVTLEGIVMEGEGYKVGDANIPLYLAMVTNEQWNTMHKQSGEQSWTYFLSQANTRLDFKKHPLFADGQIGLWRNILICTYPRPIVFPSGFLVNEYNAAGSIVQTACPTRAHRGFVLGAQGVGGAFGDATPIYSGKLASRGAAKTTQGNPYSWVEETKDGGNILKFYARVMNGFKKLVYSQPNANVYGINWDNGVVVFDTAQPSLGSGILP